MRRNEFGPGATNYEELLLDNDTKELITDEMLGRLTINQRSSLKDAAMVDLESAMDVIDKYKGDTSYDGRQAYRDAEQKYKVALARYSRLGGK